eukprot:6207573-Pleurochrysis_carterae.AAC.3
MHVMSSAFIASVMHPDVSRDLPSCAPRTRMRVADEADGADTKLMASDDEREAMGEKDKVRERERARQREAKEARQALLKRGLKGHPEMDRKLTQNQQGDSWCSWLSPSNWSSPTWLLKPCLELFFAGSGQSDHIHRDIVFMGRLMRAMFAWKVKYYSGMHATAGTDRFIYTGL